ncbi:DUF4180 domain-containing protein [Paenibacillus sp. 1001270B_150601_E10]|uniref:DUF4180 domain-containing protein n=1 Tax=Paenibacillus sp. 1001270B_150601_E10 TaxID=2787079 RepID=UPI0018A0ECF2|nr:DUF4180 domain-containing protein [Paenibacillus sp. 1001270B_150601_E10]
MHIHVLEKDHYRTAVIESDAIVIHNTQDALDLLGNASYQGCDSVVLTKEQLSDDFFELRTKLAGDILQKFTNYQMKLAIVGDFSRIESKSLRDFIYECNEGRQFAFKPTVEEALASLYDRNE